MKTTPYRVGEVIIFEGLKSGWFSANAWNVIDDALPINARQSNFCSRDAVVVFRIQITPFACTMRDIGRHGTLSHRMLGNADKDYETGVVLTITFGRHSWRSGVAKLHDQNCW